MSTFIETQFPIARLSAEAYKERKAVTGQTLTGIGKWWGRKPLILVRASILGMLMPASGNPKRDREIFLKILTMDDDGTWQRNKGRIKDRATFDALTYTERLKECERPENISGPTVEAWAEINVHLGTRATNLAELVEQLGQRTFGHTPRVGDSFCGGGSIPFEAARIGCEAFGSDLNPVAGLLTWASFNLLGHSAAEQACVRRAQEEVFSGADQQVTEWRIEHNGRSERAQAFLYCVEVKPEGSDYFIPLAPSWVISEKFRIVAIWHRMPGSVQLRPEVTAVSESELRLYKNKKGATVIDSRVVDPFNPNRSWSVEALRGPNGLRRWSNEDLVPRPEDVFQERLYCIRWISADGTYRYASPEAVDLSREARVLELLRERFADWQREGFIPSMAIPEGGDKTEEPIRNRGWTHWHHLFTPRQLLLHGLISEIGSSLSKDTNSQDARDLRETCDLWITDPPYADAINYHELGDFFLAWYDKQLAKAFPEWTPDARAELAVRGDGEDFRRSMVEIYKNLARHMPDNGLQMVMFTHQNPAVWADLGMILWAAGLKATAAWTISTETEAAGIKKGNYVQGTVCLVLRKRTANEPGFLDEVYPLVEDEVKRQIASMQALDEGGEPNFNDADYQLAAYAAALKVLTQYGNLDGKDVEHEVFAVRARTRKATSRPSSNARWASPATRWCRVGWTTLWRDLSLVERYYLRALDIESRGERRKGMYEELARGFGVTDIKPLLKSDKANGTRMFTPTGLAASLLAPDPGRGGGQSRGTAGPPWPRRAAGAAHPFAAAPLRHLMFAIRETAAADNSPEPGRQYLRDTFGQGYWGKREGFIALLEWLAALGNAEGMNEWTADSEAARILAGRLRNDHA
jgi:adenine-specific DNA methylase